MTAQVTQAGIRYNEWNEWNPQEYNAEYYSEITLDGFYLMEWIAESVSKLETVPVALEFGTGPTVLHTFPLANKVMELHLAEYLPVNREAVQKWLDKDPGAYDWQQFAMEFLRLEGNLAPTEAEAKQREDEIRRLVTQVLPGDAGQDDPLGPEKRGYYSLVTSLCCADSATSDKDTWRLYMRNIASLVKPGGMLVLSACGEHSHYCVGDRCFPGANISGLDMLTCLRELGFRDIDLRLREVPDSSGQGFGCTILARAIKPLEDGNSSESSSASQGFSA